MWRNPGGPATTICSGLKVPAPPHFVLKNVCMEILALVLSAFAAVTASVAAWFSVASLRTTQRSVPEELVKHIGALRVEVAQCSGNMDEYAAKIIGWRSEMQNVLEQVENVLDSVERKRRATAASASRLDRAQVQADDPLQMGHAELEQLARSRGLM